MGKKFLGHYPIRVSFHLSRIFSYIFVVIGFASAGLISSKTESPASPISLIVLDTRTSGDPALVYATGHAAGDIDPKPGIEIVVGFGSDLEQEPISGTLIAFDRAGTVLWAHTSPNNDYVMGVDLGDVEADNDPEIAVGFRIRDPRGELLDSEGNLLWYHDQGPKNYVRLARIGELRDEFAGQEVLFGGANGQLALLAADGTLIWQKSYCTCTLQSGEITDLNGDLENEIVLAAQDSSVKAIDSMGDVIWSTPIGGDVMGISVGDVTPSPGLEMVATSGRSQKFVTLLGADGGIIWQKTMAETPWSTVIEDITGDSQPEILIGFGNHDVGTPQPEDRGGVWVLNPAGQMRGDLELPSSVKFISAVDIDSAGLPEIIASNDDGALYLIKVLTRQTFFPIFAVPDRNEGIEGENQATIPQPPEWLAHTAKS